MILFKEALVLEEYLRQRKLNGGTIGFSPTMGALHKGHISLIEKSKSICTITVASIFVNPTQFNDPKDFEKYPETIESDILLLENAGCDILFLPSVEEIYPGGTNTQNGYDLGEIEHLLEGKYRPGHFQGVCQVVHRLLNIVQPHSLFMGQKDYQQCMVVKRLIQLIKMPVQLITVSTWREASGLAMSSRNLRLSEEQKQNAAAISAILQYIKDRYAAETVAELQSYATAYLLSHGFEKADYVAIADAETLQPVQDKTKANGVVCLVAAYMGEVRLIDNLVISD